MSCHVFPTVGSTQSLNPRYTEFTGSVWLDLEPPVHLGEPDAAHSVERRQMRTAVNARIWQCVSFCCAPLQALRAGSCSATILLQMI
jgi:hypothetical protein